LPALNDNLLIESSKMAKALLDQAMSSLNSVMKPRTTSKVDNPLRVMQSSSDTNARAPDIPHGSTMI
jgi:hypothetical protein